MAHWETCQVIWDAMHHYSRIERKHNMKDLAKALDVAYQEIKNKFDSTWGSKDLLWPKVTWLSCEWINNIWTLFLDCHTSCASLPMFVVFWDLSCNEIFNLWPKKNKKIKTKQNGRSWRIWKTNQLTPTYLIVHLEISRPQPLNSGFDEPMTLLGLAMECGVDPYWMLTQGGAPTRKTKCKDHSYFIFIFICILMQCKNLHGSRVCFVCATKTTYQCPKKDHV